ncbi:hypothetical protein [Sphingobacterium sp. UDSM-2020]|uniref:hypothetical protein n=1 Tax=Sphingobacterium sp. UDSM-2020 TaxID=2795738 RepID=UPI001937DFE6|nr:hypothetical protein [Sphingobacterium sp. UDSM-2020]QQD12280.1 hypothetical protein JAZ75_16925 [Sphingobacterium sp. UDSM-2020]
MANQFLIKNTMVDMRNLSASEIASLQGTNPTYAGVELFGYYEKGDTPAPILYYLSDTIATDDGGSVIDGVGYKLEHNFEGSVNIKYFGVSESLENTDIIQKTVNYAVNSRCAITFPENMSIHMNGQITLQSNTNIEGNHCRLYRTIQSANSSFFYGDNIENFYISNIKIEGVTIGIDSGYDSNNCGIRILRSSNIFIHKVEVLKMSSAFQIYHGSNAQIDSCNIHHNVLTGISGINHYFKITNNTFSDNGMLHQTGLTHDIYLINSIRSEILNNTFYNHIDPSSFHIVYKLLDQAIIDGFDEAKDSLIAYNNFYSNNAAIYVLSQFVTDNLLAYNPVKNVLIKSNNAPNGQIRIVNGVNITSQNNICSSLSTAGAMNIEGIQHSVNSIDDTVGYILNASINATRDIDKYFTKFIRTTITNEVGFRHDTGQGGVPSCTIITPVINGGMMSIFDDNFRANVKAGRVIVLSNECLEDYNNNLSINEISTEYSPRNNRDRSRFFYYSITTLPINIIKPKESIDGTTIKIAIRKSSSPNYVPITFSDDYKITQRTQDILNTNVNGSILIIEFLFINGFWHEVNCNGWSGRNKFQKDPIFKSVNTRAGSVGVQPTDSVIKVGAAIATVFNLPLASLMQGRELTFIKNVGEKVNLIPSLGDRIEGVLGDYVLNYENQYVTLVANENVWFILNANKMATLTESGSVRQASLSLDSATAPSQTYTQSEAQAMLIELRDLKTKLRTAGILAS